MILLLLFAFAMGFFTSTLVNAMVARKKTAVMVKRVDGPMAALDAGLWVDRGPRGRRRDIVQHVADLERARHHMDDDQPGSWENYS